MKFTKAIKEYFKQKGVEIESIVKLGSGLVADGFLVTYKLAEGKSEILVCRKLRGRGMSHDYFSDRLGYLLLQHNITKKHPRHVRSRDVVIYGKGKIRSLDSLDEVFQVLEFAAGESFLTTMNLIGYDFESQKKFLLSLCEYMHEVHRIEPEGNKKDLYLRHSQDFIGSEVLMDILDVWEPDTLLPIELRVKLFTDLFKLREETKLFFDRCRMIHADLHPDNVRVHENGSISVLDSARSMWGEPIDDLTSMLANFIYYSLVKDNTREQYKKAYDFLVRTYLNTKGTDDERINKVARLFLPVRLLILAHPIFFSGDSQDVKQSLVNGAISIAKDDEFDLFNPWKYFNLN
ncbi:MAG: hypothetical protein KatS3mg085_593 [Candidatus Dojkabacteria bacterium]|nr:MAG: hypothetical protein KatS3mg085_593 [Candidatus Dojkabacteria bacterium]